MQEQVSNNLRQMTEVSAPGNTPSLDEVRDKIEKRYTTALGQADLAQNSVQGRMMEVEQASIDAAGSDRLAQLRASMNSDQQVSGGQQQQHVTGGQQHQVTGGEQTGQPNTQQRNPQTGQS